MSAERPIYQPRAEDVIEFDTTPPVEASLQTIEREAPEAPSPEAQAAQDAESLARVKASLAERAAAQTGIEAPQSSSEDVVKRKEALQEKIDRVKSMMGAEAAEKTEQAAQQEAVEKKRIAILTKLDSEILSPQEKFSKKSPDLNQRVQDKLFHEPRWNLNKREKVTAAMLGTSAVGMVGGIGAGILLATPVGWFVAAGAGAAGVVGTPLVRLGQKAWHSYKEKKRQKAYEEATGKKLKFN